MYKRQVLFSTVAVRKGFSNHSIISSVKGAIEGLTVSLAAELAPEIRVNCIAPSLTETGMTKSIISNDNIKKAIESFLEKYPDTNFIIHGQKSQLSSLIESHPEISAQCKIVQCEDIVTMEDKPSNVIRNGSRSSMWSTIEAVRNKQASIAISCGNTGALMALSMVRLRKLPGVIRPAIACLWPSKNKHGLNIVLDVGADVKADALDLSQYAQMGVSYARNGLNINEPRVGLLNIGTEQHKGRPIIKQAYELINEKAETGNYNFVGFVEGSDIPSAKVDVIVTDGFTGNIALKTAEGTSKFIISELRKALGSTILGKFSSLSIGIIRSEYVCGGQSPSITNDFFP